MYLETIPDPLSNRRKVMGRSGSSPTQPPHDRALQGIIRQALQDPRLSVVRVHDLKGRVHRVHLLILSNGLHLVLKRPPPPSTRLLRLERKALENEAEVFRSVTTQIQLPVARVLSYDAVGTSLGCPYILTSYVPGPTLHQLAPTLSHNEMARIRTSLGSLIGLASQQVCSLFGWAYDVRYGLGTRSWREYFTSLVELLLRDADDMVIFLPVQQIREVIHRHGPCLDEITLPRLVILDMGDPSTVIVDPESKQITAITDLGQAIYGDVLMAEAFATSDDALLDGFGRGWAGIGSERIRYLLYSCFRSIAVIVRKYYRPDEEDLELEARRKLTTNLTQLTAL